MWLFRVVLVDEDGDPIGTYTGVAESAQQAVKLAGAQAKQDGWKGPELTDVTRHDEIEFNGS
jgi:hypothetical protein